MSTPPAARDGSGSSQYTPPADVDSLEARLRSALAPNLLLVREIGAGGMARVFLAREPALKRLVAVKVLSGDIAQTEAGRARFEREAQAVAGMSHPNIVAIHSVGELSDGTPYFIMQYVEGRSMSGRIETEGALSVAESRRTLGEVAAALAAAHKQGIIHRDIKPANILYEDATGRSLVSDFGIAAIGRETPAVDTKLTATGAIIGTPQYMSPEQLLAEPVTEKTDIYSLGLLAHELLCGSSPFDGTSPHELIAAHLRDVPAPLSQRRLEVDPELDAVVSACLSKKAAERPSADEVSRRLTPGAGALLEWPPPGLEELHGRLRRISSLYMLGGAAVALTLLALIVAGSRMSSALHSATSLLLLVITTGGLIVLGVAIVRTIRGSQLIVRAIRSGYAWMTVAETMADVRGDTGNLISASREYAGLQPDQRDRYRGDRVRREMALLIGGLLVLPLSVAMLMLGSIGTMGASAALVAALVLLAALAYASSVNVRESRAFGRLRKRRAAVPASDVARLAQPWYDSFESVRQGQRIGRGRATRPDVVRWTALAAGTLATFMLLLIAPLMVTGTLAPGVWAGLLKVTDTSARVRVANLMRVFALPRNPAITPIAAGRAAYILGGRSPEEEMRPFVERQLPDSLPPAPWSQPIPEGVLASARFDREPNIPSPLTVFAELRRGLSGAELAYLERLAKAPQWKYFDLLARAPSLDYLGARLELPFPPEANPALLPFPRFRTVREMAYASASRAAYHLAAGRRDSAEVALRATVSVGFLLIDEGNSIIEELVGALLVTIGRQGLTDYFRHVGDPRGARIQAQMDSVNSAQDAAIALTDEAPLFLNTDIRDVAALRDAVSRAALDPQRTRGFRMAMLSGLAYSACTNVRELVFGPAEDVRETFARSRQQLARFASDSALIDLLERSSETVDAKALGLSVTTPERIAAAVGSILGNRRLSKCVTAMRMNSLTF